MKVAFALLVIVTQQIFARGDSYHPKAKSLTPAARAKLPVNTMESSQDFWNKKAQNYLRSRVNLKLNTNTAKNVIIFLGDGMSQQTVAATRMHIASEQTELSFEQFPHFGLSKTYCVDRQVPDSACTSTSYLNGVKTNYRTIGVTANVRKSDCNIDEEDHTESIAGWAQKASKATGIVTTTRITHASPSGVYAHTSNRDWEDNSDVELNCGHKVDSNVQDIAYQLVNNEVAKNLKVILGGGRRHFLNRTMQDEEGRPGRRTDGKNLIDEWLEARNRKAKAEFVWHKQQLEELDVDSTDFLLGLFENDHCMYNIDIMNNNLQNQEPTLTDMTVKAIKMLQKDKNGFFLFVEGGRIDHAHHDNFAYKALEETKEFARAIDVARKMTNADETLIVVTADHSHAFSYSGYAPRGSDVLGFAENSDMDYKPYLTLNYANGPAYNLTFDEKLKERRDLTNEDLHFPDFKHSSAAPLKDETHAGDDVGVYASGPWSHLFVGNFEQNNIPVTMAFAAKIGPYKMDSKSSAHSHTLSIASISCLVVLSLTVRHILDLQ